MAEQKQDGPHPRREPRFPGPLTLEGVEQIFEAAPTLQNAPRCCITTHRGR